MDTQALTSDQWKDLIVKELNGGALLEANVGVLWQMHAQWARMPRLRYLYTRVSAIDFLLGNLDETYTTPVEGDRQSRLSERVTILLNLRRLTVDLIQQSGARAGSYLVGQLSATAPVGPPTDVPYVTDANDMVFYGDPYRRIWPPEQPA